MARNSTAEIVSELSYHLRLAINKEAKNCWQRTNTMFVALSISHSFTHHCQKVGTHWSMVVVSVIYVDFLVGALILTCALKQFST